MDMLSPLKSKPTPDGYSNLTLFAKICKNIIPYTCSFRGEIEHRAFRHPPFPTKPAIHTRSAMVVAGLNGIDGWGRWGGWGSVGDRAGGEPSEASPKRSTVKSDSSSAWVRWFCKLEGERTSEDQNL